MKQCEVCGHDILGKDYDQFAGDVWINTKTKKKVGGRLDARFRHTACRDGEREWTEVPLFD